MLQGTRRPRPVTCHHICRTLEAVLGAGAADSTICACRSELTSIKRKCTRKTAATLEDPNEMFEKLLRFVQLLCEGHFTEMQELLNQQPASNSINLWGEIAKYLNLFKDTTRLCRMNARVMRQLLDTLTEGMQGPCQQTQKILLESNLHEFCGRLLCIREEDYSCSCYLHAFRWRNNCDVRASLFP
jgi:NADH pyrophosphatase NudC (nudix superfamily)